jgi:CrcB protein
VVPLLLVVLGSGLGGGLRYLVDGGAQRAFGSSFPVGTLGVNVIGSFLITIVMHLGRENGLFSAEIRLLLATGVLGGFTTYSAFNQASLRFLSEGKYGMAVLNIGVTVVACLLAALLGTLVMRWLPWHGSG